MMWHCLSPKSSLQPSEVRHGMRMLVLDAVFVQAMGSLTMGAFLIGYALSLGASNTVIGILSGLGPFSVVLQVPAVYLIQRYPFRKAIVIIATTISRLVWLPIALLPFLAPRFLLMPLLLTSLFIHFAFGNIGGCAFNSWMRDLIPENRMSMFFARRMALGAATSAALSLVGGGMVDLFRSGFSLFGAPVITAYSLLFMVSVLAGMTSEAFLIRTPEPRMPHEQGQRFWEALKQPVKDRTFRQLLIFLGSWNFAINFASPFFAVYMLERLGMSMSWVIGFGVVSQLVNVRFFGFWGKLADRFSNKSVLMFTAPLFATTFLLWPFTTMPNQYFLTIPLLVLIHALAGFATAGVNLCAGNLALKSAPYGKAGAYLAINALVSGMAATLAPILAGLTSDALASREISLALHFNSTVDDYSAIYIPALSLRGLDFVFVIAFFLGIYAIHRLLSVVEKGDVAEKELRQELFAEMIRVARQVSTVAGVRHILFSPFALVRELSRSNEPPEM